MESVSTEASGPQVLFRRGKKRKTYRQKGDDEEGDVATQPLAVDEQEKGSLPTATDAPIIAATGTADVGLSASIPPKQPEQVEEEADEGGLSVAEALRLRNARKSKLRGVELRADVGPREEPAPAPVKDTSEEALAVSSTEMILGGVVKRFAPQTGLVGELVNRHMEEYIESELARRHFDKAAADAVEAANQDPNQAGGRSGPSRNEPVPQPALRGKLIEVDLGQEMRSRNAALTDRARRRLHGEPVEDNDVEGDDKAGTGSSKDKDGKQVSRPKQRRGSDDALRDQLVEEFMAENRLDVYDVPQQQESNMSLDDRVANQFRREFMEALHARHRRRRAAQPRDKRRDAKKEDEILRGPKLGGSRNTRAQYRDILLKQEQQKKAAARQ